MSSIVETSFNRILHPPGPIKIPGLTCKSMCNCHTLTKNSLISCQGPQKTTSKCNLTGHLDKESPVFLSRSIENHIKM